MPLELQDAAYGDAATTSLIEEIQQEMVVRYGGPDETLVDPEQFGAPGGAFVVATLEGEVVGCCGLRRHTDTEVELKRLYVRRAYRRRGLARELLAAMEDRAAHLGYRRVVLETGTPQPEAVGLYESSGYRPIEGFGFYAAYGDSRCYARDLPDRP